MTTTSHYIISHEGDWTWVAFPNWDTLTHDKTTRDTQNAVKSQLKANSFRWGRKRQQWYCRRQLSKEKVTRIIKDARATVLGGVQTESNAFDYIPASLNVPQLYGQDGEKDPIVYVKLFGGSSFTWLITEYDAGEDMAFGFACLGDPDMAELGYISIAELRDLTFPPFGTRVERDIWWKPMKLSEAKECEFGIIEHPKPKRGRQPPDPAVQMPNNEPEETYDYDVQAIHCKPAFLNVLSREERVWGIANNISGTSVYNELMKDESLMALNQHQTFFDKRTLLRHVANYIQVYDWYLDDTAYNPSEWCFRRTTTVSSIANNGETAPSPEPPMRTCTAESDDVPAGKPVFQTINWAEGLAVYAPVIVPDDDRETIVLLQMIGPAESVKANWAAIMNKGAARYVNGCEIALNGMNQHVKLERNLPCGYREQWLIHRQASFVEMSPEPGFFYVTEVCGNNQFSDMPDVYFALMLDKALSTPLLTHWASYLWEIGTSRSLIVEIPKRHCFGTRAWKVRVDVDHWNAIIQKGLHDGQLEF